MSAMTMMKKSPTPSCYKIIIILIITLLCMVLQVVAAASCIDKERRALVQFKAAIVDHYGMLSSWRTDLDHDCCQWEGVSCNNRTGHVHSLHLHGEQWSDGPYLSGRIHTSLMELQHLHYLNLSCNYFADTHIPEFFGSMTSLRCLDLSSCQFLGKIPLQFGSLLHLKYLNLASNELEGSIIPYQLGSLSNLNYLDLSSCSFAGKIPIQFGSLLHLKYLNLASNELEGSIPYQLGNLSKLQYLNLEWNKLQGTIPSQLGNLSSLQQLYLGGHNNGALKLEGESHRWLSSLTSLTHLDLSRVLNLNTSSHNCLQMIGKLPKLQELTLNYCGLSDHSINLSLSSLSKFNFSASLSALYLSGNTFTSLAIFQWVSNIGPNLVELYLSGNLLEGSTSKDFGSTMTSHHLSHVPHHYNSSHSMLPKLRELSLSGCNLSDNFLMSLAPSKFNIYPSLSTLDLSFNSFTSFKIFQWVSNIGPNLVELRLSGNTLEGSGSSHFGIVMNSLEDLDLSYNRLKGGGDLKSFMNVCTLCYLDVRGNNLIEDLPSILHNLSAGCVTHSLQELDLSDNQITGTLPDLSIFSSLKTFDLSSNRLSGKIPGEIRLPSQLESLRITSNSLEGGIPKSFGNICTLTSLIFSNNTLSEELPMIIEHLSGCARNSLEKLDLSINRINGTLLDFSVFPSLKYLSLSKNKLNGKISEDIGFPPQLEELDISSNCLNGVITESHFVNVSKLRWLDFSDNSVTFLFSQNWIPPFQLRSLGLRSCQLGPHFPKWLKTQNQLSDIDISNAGISDIVPEWFWSKLSRFNEFASLNISCNNLKGAIPNLPLKSSGYFLSLSLSLESNQFEGPIPAFLRGAMSLDLSKNKFSDLYSFVCANFTSETLLCQLDLSNNQFSGQIPNCWSRFKSLAYLDLSHNNFLGKIPASMGSLTELQALLLRNNSLSEEIPSSMKSCTQLVMLDVAENELSGRIPSWIGSELQELQILILQKNCFFGSLPIQLCYLQSVQLMDVSFNNLSGMIPNCINNFTLMAKMNFSEEFQNHYYLVNTSWRTYFIRHHDLNALLTWKGVEQMFMDNELPLLKSIDFSSNQLSGGIPVEIEDLLGLVSVNLSRNNLTGEIPSNIGRLSSLEFLDLSRNQLSGQIPSSLTKIDRLTMLDVSHNHLSGRIPTGTQLQSFDPSRYEDNLDLCGEPLKKLCIEEESPQVQSHEEGHKAAFANAFYTSMGVGFAVGFWGIFGSILVKRSWRHAYFRFFNKLTDDIYVITTVKINKYKRWLGGQAS